MTNREVFSYLNTIAPFSTQEDWDNSGFLVGDPEGEVHTVGVSLDITRDVIQLAQKAGIDLLVSHHPVIFKPQSALLQGQAAYLLASSGISAICAHTNWDVAKGGVSDALGERLGCSDLRQPENPGLSALRLAGLDAPMESRTLAQMVKERLGAAQVRFNEGETIRSAAFCGGAGADFWRDAKALGAQALVTGDCSYHDFLDAHEAGFTIVAAGHYHTEWPGVERLANKLANAFGEVHVELLCQECPVLGL